MQKICVSQAKARARPQRREPAGSSSRTIPMERRNWVDIEPGKYSFSEYEVSKKVTFFLRHSQHVHREEDGTDTSGTIVCFRVLQAHSGRNLIHPSLQDNAVIGQSSSKTQTVCFLLVDPMDKKSQES